MKYLTNGQVLFALLFVVVFAILIVTATGYNPMARTMPLIVAIPAFLGAIGNLIVDVRAVQRGEKPKIEKIGPPVALPVASEPAAVAPPSLKVAPAGGAVLTPATTGAKPLVIDVEAAKKKIKKKDKISPEMKRKRELIGIAWLIGYVAALILFGFNLATLVYLVAFIKFYSHESWKLTIVYAAVLWVFVYVAFVVLLKSTLAPGMVFDWLQR